MFYRVVLCSFTLFVYKLIFYFQMCMQVCANETCTNVNLPLEGICPILDQILSVLTVLCILTKTSVLQYFIFLFKL